VTTSFLPYVFTEHGALMLGNILKSSRAVEVSLLIVKTFVQLRELLSSNKTLAAKLNEFEQKLIGHDRAILGLIEAIKQLTVTPVIKKRPIGFDIEKKGNK